jgi:hypothetical protein
MSTMMTKTRRDAAVMWCTKIFVAVALVLSVLSSPLFVAPGEGSMPAYLGYLYVGVLGALVSQVLTTQQGRIAELERALEEKR